ncbi:DNA ligase [Candidatus Thorarchaeota archaeon]|nr:MAG: DNA ligase [Candidatus Thorarchaeota archaeon]
MTDEEDKLKDYKAKRDFSKTSEPEGKEVKSGKSIFVVQKHDASNLHYDFRIEMDGVLKSWAVPKGPSMNPSVRRLAVPTEDHPLDYAEFEGVIPEGEYGAGAVIVWDTGTFRNMKADKEEDKGRMTLEESHEEGKMELFLDGEKLKGGFALIRTGGGKKPRWLLIKMRDDFVDEGSPITEREESVESGRTLDEVRGQE